MELNIQMTYTTHAVIVSATEADGETSVQTKNPNNVLDNNYLGYSYEDVTNENDIRLAASFIKMREKKRVNRCADLKRAYLGKQQNFLQEGHFSKFNMKRGHDRSC